MVQMKNIYYRAFIERVTLVLAGIGIVGMVLLGGCRKELISMVSIFGHY